MLRFLGSILFALVLATLAGIAGLIGLTRWNQGSTPTAAAVALPVPAATPPPPAALAPIGDRAPAIPAEATLVRTATGPATVTVVDLPATAPAPGLCILDGASGCLLAWRDLEPGPSPAVVELDRVPTGRHWAALAWRPEAARFAYLVRVPLTVAGTPAEPRATARLSAALHQVEVAVRWVDGGPPPGPPPTALPLVTRLDDPGWTYRTAAGLPAAVEDPAAGFRLALGPGRYSVGLLGLTAAGTGDLTFAVPDDLEVTLTCRAR